MVHPVAKRIIEPKPILPADGFAYRKSQSRRLRRRGRMVEALEYPLGIQRVFPRIRENHRIFR